MLPETPQHGEPFRILVVEDEIKIAQLVAINLSRAGFHCQLAPDGLAGLEVFKEMNPHLVVLDVMMPGMDGHEVCRKIRETSTVPVIMLTALNKDEDQVQGLKLGADDYVTKPFNPQLLVARVIAQLRRNYRYVSASTERAPAATEPTPTTSAPKVPTGWAICEACGYMGPRPKFQKEDSSGEHFLSCPACKRVNCITFSL